MGRYSLVTDEDRAKYAPELVGQGHVIVTDGEKFWVVKHKPGLVDIEKRESLGYLLGHKFSNVAEVRLLDQEEHRQVRTLAGKGEDSLLSNTFLVRLGGSYSVAELPCQTVEKAVVTELVYSTWIRRRDAHADNRVYVNEIPVFFDHHVAFLGETEQANIITFFNPQPASYGHAGAWRIIERQDGITTLEARTGNKAHHYVRDQNSCRRQIEDAKIDLISSLEDGWEDAINKAGFVDSKRDEMAAFLKRNLETLNDDIKMMQQIIFQP